jgi:hypothetical protein
VDAPITSGMTLAMFRRYYKAEYGNEGMRTLDERLARANKNGTSAFGYDDEPSLESTVLCNRAGAGESRMTVQQIADWYCVNRDDYTRDLPVGEWPYEDE